MQSNGAYKAHTDTFTDYSRVNLSRPSKAEFWTLVNKESLLVFCEKSVKYYAIYPILQQSM